MQGSRPLSCVGIGLCLSEMLSKGIVACGRAKVRC